MTREQKSFLFGAAVGTGMAARAVDSVGADFLLILNAGRLRTLGVSSLGCYLPLRNCNEWVFEIAAREVLGKCESPVIAGLSASHPVTPPGYWAQSARNRGFDGVCNFPSVTLLDGTIRQSLDTYGLGFQREVDMLAEAARLGMKTVAYVTTNKEARRMADAGVGYLCVNLGFTSGPTGVDTPLSLQNAAEIADKVLDGIPSSIGAMIEGGPITSPEKALEVTRLSRVNGYIAGSTIDRLPIEEKIVEVARSYKVISALGRDQDGPDDSAKDARDSAKALLNRHSPDLDRIARTEIPVLVFGETGTGKSAVAAAIHARSPYWAKPVCRINCASLDRGDGMNLLFGTGDGQIPNGNATPTDAPSPGLLAEADNTTLILENIDALPMALQGALLSFCEDGHYRAMGGSISHKVKTRIVATSMADLETEMREGRFRADLFHRLNAYSLQLPALRDRKKDIPDMLERFARQQSHIAPVSFSNSAIRLLLDYDWPGNIRELQHVVSRVQLASTGKSITAGDLDFLSPQQGNTDPQQILDADQTMDEREWIYRTLQHHNFRKGKAAAALGMSPRTLYNKMKRYGI